jgi:signal transduction histidine kinase
MWSVFNYRKKVTSLESRKESSRVNIDIAQLYVIVAVFFIFLPVAVFVATSEFRERQVYWWCIGGLSTGVGFLLIGLRGIVPDYLSFYIAQVFFTIGFSFRSLSLRLELSSNIYRTMGIYAVLGAFHLIVFSVLAYHDASSARFLWATGYFVLMSLDLMWISQTVYGPLKNKGGKLIAWMALFILIGILVRVFGYITNMDGEGVFEPGLDQYIGLCCIMIGYLLGNFGFIQLRLEKLWENKKRLDLQLFMTLNKNHTLEEMLEEKSALMRTLSLSAKANSMGTMLGAIAHEINQPLSAIRINTELLMTLNRRSGDREGFQASLEHILQDNERAAVVVSSLRKFFFKGSNEFSPIDMSGLVSAALRTLIPEARMRSVYLRVDIEPDLWILGDQNQIQMVTLNLINNAMDAVVGLSGDKNVFIHLFQREKTVVLEVSDNGPGILESQAASIFELFNTSKEKGMGMGLWLSRAIMDSHEGSIKLLKGPASETLFQVSLPACIKSDL